MPIVQVQKETKKQFRTMNFKFNFKSQNFIRLNVKLNLKYSNNKVQVEFLKSESIFDSEIALEIENA